MFWQDQAQGILNSATLLAQDVNKVVAEQGNPVAAAVGEQIKLTATQIINDLNNALDKPDSGALIIGQIDKWQDQVRALWKSWAAATGRPDQGKSLDRTTWIEVVFYLGLAAVGGYFLYKWATAPTQDYPQERLPAYAGGRRRRS